MWSNFSHPITLNASCGIHVESTASVVEKKPSDKQIEFEKRLSIESDTDFQSFLLPLEQDFTKSSKGYASLLATIPNRDINLIHYKNKFEETKMNNMLLNEQISGTDLRNTCNKFLHNSLCSSEHDFTDDAGNLLHEKNAQIIDASLEIIENKQSDESLFCKSDVEITINTLGNSHKDNDVSKSDENIMFLEKRLKFTCDYTILPNLDRFSDKSEDDDSSELSETDSSYYDCNNALSFDDSSTDDSIIFSEQIFEKENQCPAIKIRQTFFTAINSESSDDDCDESLKESKESTSTFFAEDCTFEFSSVSLLKNPMDSQNLYDPIIAFSSQGYINACFEDDNFVFEKSSSLKNINERWNDSMKNVSGKPRESKKVSFVPLPDLVSVYSYEPEDDNYCYSLYVLDQLRFQSRIQDFESIIAPYLTPEHRANIYRRNCF